MNKALHNELMDLFIMKDYMACNRWLPVDPRRQAMSNYQSDPTVQQRINGIVGDILEVIEKHDCLHSEKN